jgi:hypothetical protein
MIGLEQGKARPDLNQTGIYKLGMKDKTAPGNDEKA